MSFERVEQYQSTTTVPIPGSDSYIHSWSLSLLHGFMDEARTRSPPVRPARPTSMTPLYDDLPQRSTGEVATNTTPPLPASGHPSITKRRSIVNIRAVSQSHSKLPVQTGHGPVRYSTGASTLGSDKKGSFRNAVRKLFGRKSKVDPVPVQHSPPRHGYHKSVRNHGQVVSMYCLTCMAGSWQLPETANNHRVPA